MLEGNNVIHCVHASRQEMCRSVEEKWVPPVSSLKELCLICCCLFLSPNDLFVYLFDMFAHTRICLPRRVSSRWLVLPCDRKCRGSCSLVSPHRSPPSSDRLVRLSSLVVLCAYGLCVCVRNNLLHLNHFPVLTFLSLSLFSLYRINSPVCVFVPQC